MLEIVEEVPYAYFAIYEIQHDSKNKLKKALHCIRSLAKLQRGMSRNPIDLYSQVTTQDTF